MSHYLGPIVPFDQTVTDEDPISLTPRAGALGGPHFVILHFDNVSLSDSARLIVELGYGQDVFNSDSGSNFWTRPVDTSIGAIDIRITDGTGSARLVEFGAGEPSVTPNHTPGTSTGSQSNPDVFLHESPYTDPIFETRLKCGEFDWRNSACSLSPSISDAVKNKVAAATGIIVEIHRHEGEVPGVSSCSGTLIGPDLFLTARHCLAASDGEDRRSASVTFDYATNCDFTRPPGHATRFFKVLEEVASGSAPTGIYPPPVSDWVVVRLDAAPGALPPPLQMRDAALMNGETIFTMHHPNGSAKKCQAGVHSGGTFAGDITISGFDYGGGSSGSALFDVTGKLVAGPLSQGLGTCTVVYAPISTVKATLQNPPPPPRPLDVVIVFDKSGSMGSTAPPINRTKLREAQDAASLFVQLVREGAGDRLGMVTFDTFAAIPTNLGPVAAKKNELVGAAPFTSGDIGAITAGGATSIGGGLGTAALALAAEGSNDSAMLLLSDGLQNSSPMVSEIENLLGNTKLNVIGFGTDADLDGPLLSRLAREHHGQFTRALDGLGLRKFFGLAFGNIFETGALLDPEYILKQSQQESDPHKFSVCGEEQITVILGWDDPSTPLTARIITPNGNVVSERRIRPVRGRTWVFWKVPLPYQGERDGSWSVVVDRFREFPHPADVRYFLLIVCSGGPKLTYLGGPRHVYTGDPLDSLVGLHFPNGTAPHGHVELVITAPEIALGQLVIDEGLIPPSTGVDPVNGFYNTLQQIQRRHERPLPVGSKTITVPLFDDGAHFDGALEPDGIYNNRLRGLTKVEGTYEFRAIATYGEECSATRETFWSIHVEPGIDPNTTGVRFDETTPQPDGRHGTIVITPRDPFKNPLGPGRGDRFTVNPIPGVKINGKVTDRKNGDYAVDVIWDPSQANTPGVAVEQPDRDPQTMTAPPPPGGFLEPGKDCGKAAESLLDCLGLKGADVKKVRVKSISLEIDLKDDKDC